MKYISFYDTQTDRRSMCLAATNKIDYICNAINDIGYEVEIIACGAIASENIPACEEQITENTRVKFFKTVKTSKCKLKRIYNIFRQNILLFNYLLKNTSKDEQVIVYHSLGIMRAVYLAKKIINFKLILEVEEIYNDVHHYSSFSKNMELKFIKCADKYIFPTRLLNDKFNYTNKPYVLIHGTYQVEPDREQHFEDDKIHIVYAGTFDLKKGGVNAAILSAKYLPKNYHLHILGFGNNSEIEITKKLIADINAKSQSTVTYDGLLSGEKYISFLQKCDIGLSTQNPSADFNATSFPSKVLSYMANNLRVVSIKISAVETSDVGNDVYYYQNQIPEEIAKTIMSIDFNDNYNGRMKIKELNEKFKIQLTAVLEA